MSLCDPMDFSPRLLCPWILQTRILEWVAMPSSRGSSLSKDSTRVSHIAGRFFTAEPSGKPADLNNLTEFYILGWPKSLFMFFCKFPERMDFWGNSIYDVIEEEMQIQMHPEPDPFSFNMLYIRSRQTLPTEQIWPTASEIKLY